jgi:putative ABC transport system ATP-binding protein
MSESEKGDLIVTKAVTKTYQDDGVPVKAVRGIDLTIAKGEFTAIVGPSGSGKTTFLNLISGLDTVTEGEVWLEGRKLSDMSGRELSDFRRDHIGFIFQAYNLIPVLTVEENVEYIMLLQSIPAAERHRRINEILKVLGIDEFADRLPTKLSGGQQQRVAVARAMVSRPSFILADLFVFHARSENHGACPPTGDARGRHHPERRTARIAGYGSGTHAGTYDTAGHYRRPDHRGGDIRRRSFGLAGIDQRIL